MSVAEKRKVIGVAEKRKVIEKHYETCSDAAFEVLQKWTCEEILQVLSAEAGNERKYKGLSKAKMINILLNVLAEKERLSSPTLRNSKRPRKNVNPSRYVDPMSVEETKVFPLEEEEEKETLASFLKTKDKHIQLDIKEDQSTNDRVEDRAGENASSLEYCVKMIRELERSGLVERRFRLRFLTWYSLRATAHDMLIVKTYIDCLKDDPTVLADQLLHTFSDHILTRLPVTTEAGKN